MIRRKNRQSLLSLLKERWPDSSEKDLYSSVLCGEILVNGETIRNPKESVPKDSTIDSQPRRFVGRGGEKLDGVLDQIDFDPKGRVCIDAGASTGGFTDCLLQRGASFVHSVDVGFNQIAWKLRSNDRVAVREKTNIMHLRSGDLEPAPDIAVADLSFRSLRGAAAQLLKLTRGGAVLALVKPQFEQPRDEGFDGVVRNDQVREEVVFRLRDHLKQENVFVHDAVPSPISGRKGNAELFLLLGNTESRDADYAENRLEEALEAIRKRES